ncbi:MAG: radical SAM protein, partial [Verrucomicrobia bacterium]|nr:radical SAM protein [Verrucomicrobiota bacterium]
CSSRREEVTYVVDIRSRGNYTLRAMITLIRPPATDVLRFATTSISPPIGLAYIAGALESAGYSVGIVDAVGENPKTITRGFKGFLIGLRIEEMVERIDVSTQLIGISTIFTHEWPIVVMLIRLIRKRFPDVPIMVGGEHVTSMPEFCLHSSDADYMVLGEGEETCVELARSIFEESSHTDIHGIAYRDGSTVVVNPRRQRNTEVDDIPRPAWHLFDIANYKRHGLIGGIDTDGVTIPMLATRGCPYQCTYCSSPNMWTTRWVARTPSNVVDEMEYYMREFGATNFPLQDLTAIIQKDWIVDFCQLIIDRKLNITWQLPTGTRAEAIDEEVAELLQKSGMITMAYAPESGSDETRDLIKKRIHKPKLLDSMAAAVKYNLHVSCFFVLGFPHDTPAQFADSLSFVRQLAETGAQDIAIGFYMALPGTELFRRLYNDGKVTFDRSYFRHILDSQTMAPSNLYMEAGTRPMLSYWKLRIYFEFYGAKSHKSTFLGVIITILSALPGIFKKKHVTRMETAFRNFLTNCYRMSKAQFGKRWMPYKEELEMFAPWSELFASTMDIKAAAAPLLKQEGKINFMKVLKTEHAQRKVYPVESKFEV